MLATLLTTIIFLGAIYLYFTADEQALLRYTRLCRSGQRESSRTRANPVRMQLTDKEGNPHLGHKSFVDNHARRDLDRLFLPPGPLQMIRQQMLRTLTSDVRASKK